jgi:hypothetical protein
MADLRSRSARFLYEVVTAEARPRQLAHGMTRHICLLHGAVAPLPLEIRGAAD